MLPQSVLVEGLIIGSQDGTGLADRSIEAWSLDEEAFSPLAEARSDAQGMFVLDLPLVPGFEVEGGIARIEFRILDRSELILAEIRELALDQGPQPMQFSFPTRRPLILAAARWPTRITTRMKSTAGFGDRSSRARRFEAFSIP